MPRPGAHQLLDQLLKQLKIDTRNWTYASTPFLNALATPTARDAHSADVLIRFTACDPDLADIGGWAVKIRERRPQISAEIEDGWRVHLVGVPRGVHWLEAYKPVSMLPSPTRDRLARALTEAAAACARLGDMAAANRWAALPRGVHQILNWETGDGLLSLVIGITEPGDDATIWFRSRNTALDGVRIAARAGSADRALIMRDVGDAVEGETRFTFTECREAHGQMSFGAG